MTSATEIELKFQVPAAQAAALRRAVATRGAVRTRLQAVYADTADSRLAAAGIALRLRKEGRRWVQTLKGRGDGMMQRLEHEVELPPQRGIPQLDIGRHAGTEAAALLAAALGDPPAELRPLYRTDILRTHRTVHTGGGLVEIAFDEGRIHGGERRLAVCEIEFELLRGPPQALLALAARWVRRHRLWLDVRTKAERGHRLALDLDRVPAVKAGPTALQREMAPPQALAAMLQSALAQVLPNAAEIGAGTHGAEQVHQLRVGLRRARCALRVFGVWAHEPALAHALEKRLRDPFTRLGAARDLDALSAVLLPALQAAGAPEMQLLHGAAPESPNAVVRDPAFSELLLELLALTQAPPPQAPARWALPAAAAAPAPDAREPARKALARLHRKVLADAARFVGADEAAQHRTRKRLKRLRYACEFVAPLFPARPQRALLAPLRDALEALGDYNDLLVAQGLFRAAVDRDPRAWFAIGWLQARRELLLARCGRSLKKLAAAKVFWRD